MSYQQLDRNEDPHLLALDTEAARRRHPPVLGRRGGRVGAGCTLRAGHNEGAANTRPDVHCDSLTTVPISHWCTGTNKNNLPPHLCRPEGQRGGHGV